MFGLGLQEILVLAFCALVPVSVAMIVLVVVLVSRNNRKPDDRDRD